jgi:hypothetical protein
MATQAVERSMRWLLEKDIEAVYQNGPIGEQQKKTGGVCWGIELEMCEQVNRVLFVSVTNGLRNLPRSRWLC